MKIDVDQPAGTLRHKCDEYGLVAKSWTSPKSLLNPMSSGGRNYCSFEIDWHNSILRNLVYERVRVDLSTVLLELAKEYGVEITRADRLFST